jgi:VWFA-related protein
MYPSVPFPVLRRFTTVALLCCASLFCRPAFAQTPAPTPPAQDTAPKNDSTAKPAPAPTAADQQEVATHDTPATFKVRVNLVLVHVVVRDNHGQVVPNLKKEDFQLLDNKKIQSITAFSVETPGSHIVRSVAAPGPEPSSAVIPDSLDSKPVELPQRFVSMVFDDVHMSMEDVVFVRDSASRFFGALAPGDRAGIYSTSGQVTQEFTQDHEALKNALLRLAPRSAAFHTTSECPDISYYQADLIVNKTDAQALDAATEDALQCAFDGDPTKYQSARIMAQGAASREVTSGDGDTEYSYRHLEEVIRRLSGMPGQRVLVLISPGFIQSTLRSEAYDLVDRATRSGIVINAIDARGLYVPDLGGDISSPSSVSFRSLGIKTTYRVAAQTAQEEVLEQLADGTGGIFYHNRNDVDEAMREAGAAPAVSYLLGFSPQNMKLDGRFHNLKVVLTSKEKYSIQARHGYFAPRTLSDPAETSKEEIQEALFSQEEIRDLPVDFQTQFFKKDQTGSRLAVLTHLDVKGIRFRKAEGRNNDKLTIATGIFDENGNFITGGAKIIELKLLDTTYARLSHSGFTVKSSYDVMPGRYLVRLVVREDEGAQMAARNGAVIIPD